MNALVVFEPRHGAAAALAKRLVAQLRQTGLARAVPVDDVMEGDLLDVDVLILGTHCRRWWSTPAAQRYLERLPSEQAARLMGAAFDIRPKQSGAASARSLVRTIRRRGMMLLWPAESFYVEDDAEALPAEEEERAVEWARQLALRAQQLRPQRIKVRVRAA